MQHKYVRFEKLGFILWPYSDDLHHAHIGRTGRQRLQDDEIISAGFAFIKNGAVCCVGKSESLGIESRADDGLELAKQLGLEADHEQ